ncbi:MAG: ROK family protein [Oscillospiraceae bacterium]|nr:ROK family protein [Oscillospiraceae bacterium]MBQ3598846.1 ROK family protein [Clostridia bacterium]
MRYGFGVDIFGPNIKFGFFDEEGNLIDKWKIAAPINTESNKIIPAVAKEVESYLKKKGINEEDVIGIGVGIPGPVDRTGVVQKCVNLGWGVFNIEHALSGLAAMKVKAGNISTLSALGESWKGSGSVNTVFMAMNTGLGGGIICDGRLVRGNNGGAGEIGHIVVNKAEKEPCACGKFGCAEQYCSPAGIVRVARRMLTNTGAPSVLRYKKFFDYKDVLKAAEENDELSINVMNRVYEYAGQALAAVCCVVNPDTVVLGGEFCKIGQPAMEGVARSFKKYVFQANENVRFTFAALDTDACIYGAFKLVLDNYG